MIGVEDWGTWGRSWAHGLHACMVGVTEEFFGTAILRPVITGCPTTKCQFSVLHRMTVAFAATHLTVYDPKDMKHFPFPKKSCRKLSAAGISTNL